MLSVYKGVTMGKYHESPNTKAHKILANNVDVFVTSEYILMYIIIVCCCTPLGLCVTPLRDV